MTMRVTILSTVMGESGSLLEAGSTYSVGDQFGAELVGSKRATDTDGVLTPDQSENKPYIATDPLTGAVKGLEVSGGQRLKQLSQTPTDRINRINAWKAGPLIPAPLWAAATAYAAGASVRLANGVHLQCTTAGTSAGAEPTGYYDGRPITDNTAVWYLQGWRASTTDIEAPTVTLAASAAAASLTETRFSTGTGPLSHVKCFDAVPFNRSSSAFVAMVACAPGNSSYAGNASGDVTAASNIPVVLTSTDAYSINQTDLEFTVTDCKFMLTFHSQTSRFQVLIDGRPVFGDLQIGSGVAGNGVVFDFNNVVKTRTVTVACVASAAGAGLRGCALTAQGSLGSVQNKTDVMLMLGDSFCMTVTAGSGVHDGHLGTFLKRYLGLGGLVNAGVGGSGYITAPANGYNVPTMLSNANNTTLFSYLNPSHILFNAAFNDRSGYTVAATQAAALASWQAARAKFPNAKITVIDGNAGSAGPDANAIALAAGLLATFTSWGDANSRFVQSVGAGSSASFIWGTGKADTTLATAGNSGVFTSTDSNHPSPAGARHLARQLANAISVAWNGDY